MNYDNRQILTLAVPSIVSNVTVPLLGLVDLSVVGHIGDASYIGAIAIGTMIFNVVYWLFGFLRMGTSGMTAQAFGAGNGNEQLHVLVRSLSIGVGIGMTFVVFQMPLRELMIWMMNTPEQSSRFVRQYFDVVVFGAPAMLGLYSLTGWFIGMQDTRTPMAVAIVQNVVNIVASLFFVFGMGWKIEGVAAGTLVAQWVGFIMAIVSMYIKCHARGLVVQDHWGDIMNGVAMMRFFRVNRDIFLRTVCLVAVNLFLTSAGARQGALILSVNTLLMTLFTLFSYVLDGFAYAGEALSGRYYGAGDMEGLHRIVKGLFRWGLAMVIIFTVVYAVGGRAFLQLLTSDRMVVAASMDYFFWALMVPICGMAAFIYDGVFIGMTATRGMLLSSFTATVVFFVTFAMLGNMLGNHALWLAFLLFLTVRGIVQHVILRSEE